MKILFTKHVGNEVLRKLGTKRTFIRKRQIFMVHNEGRGIGELDTHGARETGESSD